MPRVYVNETGLIHDISDSHWDAIKHRPDLYTLLADETSKSYTLESIFQTEKSVPQPDPVEPTEPAAEPVLRRGRPKKVQNGADPQ